MSWKNFLFVPLLGTLFCISICQAQISIAMLEYRPELPARPTRLSAKSYALSFELVRNMIHIQATLNDRPQRFIFDTGAPCLVLNGVPVEGEPAGAGSGGPVTVEYLDGANFSWPLSDRSAPVTIRLDLRHFETLAGVPIAGLIGYDLFKEMEVYLDYDQERLLLLPSGANELHRNQEPRYVLPFELADHLPVIAVVIGDQEYRLALDTGAGASLLRRELVDKLQPAELNWREDRELQGLDRNVQHVRTFSIDRLAWHHGPAVEDLLFLESDLSVFDRLDFPRIDGILGYNFFRQFRLSIDYPARKIYIW
jgi:hypothetical protein